jgi:hypothetical protein
MTKCEFLGKKNFKKILKFFIAPRRQLESLNLNNYGLYRNQKFTIKSLKISKFLALKEFHFLSIDFELQDFVVQLAQLEILLFLFKKILESQFLKNFLLSMETIINFN